MNEKNDFQLAVENTPEISNCYQVGLKALGNDSGKISVKDTALICGSVDLDACVEKRYANENRWDFIICYDSQVYFVEIHGAITSEVSTMVRKLNWLKTWLNEKAPLINAKKAKGGPFYWVQAGKFDIPKHSRQYRQLEQSGFLPIPGLRLG